MPSFIEKYDEVYKGNVEDKCFLSASTGPTAYPR
jgi:hypothetical protein